MPLRIRTPALPAPLLKRLWLKVSGAWVAATTWIKVAGVWKQATPWIKDSGTWK